MSKNDLKLIKDIIIILISIISFSIFIVINQPYLYLGMARKYHYAKVVGISYSVLKNTYFKLLLYLNGLVHCWNPPFSYSLKGIHHFTDVRHLVIINNMIMIIFGIWAIKIIYYYLKGHMIWQLITPLRLIEMGIWIFLFLVLVKFNTIFIIFHKILFQNNNWIFNPQTDPIIKILTPDFFENCFLLVIILWFMGDEIIIRLGKRELKINKKKR